MKQIGILGGGIAGLSLSYFLGADSEILEKDSTVGGLCRSFRKDGFTYDLGGHIIFSKDTEILDFELSMLGDRAERYFRKNSVWFKGRHVKYPFENGLSALDKDDIFDILYHFIDNPPRAQHNFRDWIYNTFGRGLAEKYLIPYNRKIWNTDPAEMSTQWVERIPKPPLADLIKSALGIETEGYVHQLYFHYPKTGGFQTLPESFAEKVEDRIVRNFPVERIERKGKLWRIGGPAGEREYERIVSTMPIFDMMSALTAVPPEVRRAVDNLRFNSLIVVMVGVQKERLVDQFAVYCPQPDLIFHRLCFYGYFGRAYVPEGATSVVAEITAREGDEVWSLSDSQVAQRVVDDLAREGFIDRKDVITTDVKRTKYAYVIYDLDYAKNTAVIHDFCRSQGIELCGRFAEFVYYNSDAVIRSAKTVAARMAEAR